MIKYQRYSNKLLGIGKDSNNYERTALAAAVTAEREDVVTYLLSLPEIDVSIKADKSDCNALHYAGGFNERTYILEILLDHPTCTNDAINCLDKYGNTPLDRVFTFNKSDGKKSLITLFENHGAKRKKELEALINAARKEDVEAVKKLLKDDNIDLSKCDNHGRNALHWAAQNNVKSDAIMQALLNHPKCTDEVINEKDKYVYGWTPLDWAYSYNRSRLKTVLISLLKEKGAKRASEINKMLKDDKNNDYKDQIYFALAEIALKEDEKELAIDHLLNSTANNSGNDQQQSIAHLTLAEIYFNDAEYLSAQIHYDTAITFLSENHPDFNALSKKRESLNELVSLYNTIALSDSLYKLSELGEEELKTIIDAVIEEKKEEDRLAEEALRANAGSRPNTNSQNQFNPMSSGGGKWYFYNPSAISFGYSEFITKWGERRLEDDWRRKNKRQIILDEDGEDGEEKDIYSQEYYMDLIPFTDSAKSATIELIVESFYQLGLIYKEELKDFNEAINAFETLIEAYPKNKYESLSYYQLYSSYKLLKNDSIAEEYVQKLKQEYPDCEYLKMILDPEGYYSENKESIDSTFVYYEEIFTAFSNQEYEYVLAKSTDLDSIYEVHPVADQLSLISALSHGHLFGEDTLKAKLEEIINTYYSGEVVDEAREILQGLESKNTEPEETRFELDLKEEHYYILALEGGRTNINKTKITVSNFNRKFYNIKEYKTQSLMLNIDYQLIIVKPFENGNSALKYLEGIKNAEELKGLLGTSDYEHFIISSSNFKAFYKDKSLDKYVVYFEEAYLKQK